MSYFELHIVNDPQRAPERARPVYAIGESGTLLIEDEQGLLEWQLPGMTSMRPCAGSSCDLDDCARDDRYGHDDGCMYRVAGSKRSTRCEEPEGLRWSGSIHQYRCPEHWPAAATEATS